MIAQWLDFGAAFLAEYFRLESEWDNPILGIPLAGRVPGLPHTPTNQHKITETMSRKIDLRNQRFGRLLVIEPATESSKRNREIEWICRCECGNEITVISSHLRNGNTRSCGCLITKGEDHYSAKLDEPTVLRARELSQQGFTLREIIDHMNLISVSKSALSLAINKKTWKHLP